MTKAHGDTAGDTPEAHAFQTLCPPRCLKMAALRAPREGMNPQRHLHGTRFLCCVPRLICVSLVRRFQCSCSCLPQLLPEFLSATPVPLPPYYYIHSILQGSGAPKSWFPAAPLCPAMRYTKAPALWAAAAEQRRPTCTGRELATPLFVQAVLYVIKPCQ